jgi:16S rRNA (guanine527-N7)-methyltransferase
MNEEELWLYTLGKKNGVIITDIQIRQLTQYKLLLLDWNKKINLVSRKNEENIWKGHIALSLTMLFKIHFRNGMKVLDLGTGGGFPGIPLSIMLPECSFLLLDSTQKKINAVQSMIDALQLKNARTVWGRAEELQKDPKLSRSFDAVVARSVSSLSNLIEWGGPFLKTFKGVNIENEKIALSVPSLVTFKGMEIEEEEREAKKEFPTAKLQSVPLMYPGSEEFENLDKKLMIVTQQ